MSTAQEHIDFDKLEEEYMNYLREFNEEIAKKFNLIYEYDGFDDTRGCFRAEPVLIDTDLEIENEAYGTERSKKIKEMVTASKENQKRFLKLIRGHTLPLKQENLATHVYTGNDANDQNAAQRDEINKKFSPSP